MWFWWVWMCVLQSVAVSKGVTVFVHVVAVLHTVTILNPFSHQKKFKLSHSATYWCGQQHGKERVCVILTIKDHHGGKLGCDIQTETWKWDLNQRPQIISIHRLVLHGCAAYFLIQCTNTCPCMTMSISVWALLHQLLIKTMTSQSCLHTNIM